MAPGEVRQSSRQARFLDVHPLTHFDGRGTMIHPHQNKIHGRCVETALKGYKEDPPTFPWYR